VAYEIERHDAADLVHASLSELSSLIEGRDLTVETDLPSEPVEVTWDGSLVRQVLGNVLSNAIRCTPEGGKIGIAVSRAPRAEEIEIRVRDRGPGIPDEHKERIFERFYRVDTARSRQEGGTGLGLSIVKQILQAHGESIHVESTVGRGSRFWFDLPWAEQPETDPAEAAEVLEDA
jgi:signal transduction histidine kinase